MTETAILYTLGRHSSRPERMAITNMDGSPAFWFAYDETREVVAGLLAEKGLILRDDDTIVRA